MEWPILHLELEVAYAAGPFIGHTIISTDPYASDDMALRNLRIDAA